MTSQQEKIGIEMVQNASETGRGVTWSDFDESPELRAVGVAGGDRSRRAGPEHGEAEEEGKQSKQRLTVLVHFHVASGLWFLSASCTYCGQQQPK